MERLYIKIERNAPCPCGSGKKYKKCCLPFLEESLMIDSLKFSLYIRIANYSFTNYKEFFSDTVGRFDRKDLASAKDFEDLVKNKEGWEEPLDWFIFNEYILKGKTPLQLFLEEGTLTEREKAFLRRFEGTYWSLYEVKDTIKELNRAKFIDLFSKKEYLVFSRDISYAEDGMIVFARIIPYDYFYFTGYVFTPWLSRKPSRFDEILDEFIEPFKENNSSVEEILKIYGHRLYLFMKELSKSEVKEEEPEIVSSLYRVNDYDKVISLLQLSPYFRKGYDLSDPMIFVCLKNPRSELIVNTSGIVTPQEVILNDDEESEVGAVRVDREYLEVVATTKKRLEAVETLLKEVVGDYITLENPG